MRRIYPNPRHVKKHKIYWRTAIVLMTFVLMFSGIVFMPTTTANASQGSFGITLATEMQPVPAQSISSSEAAWIGSFLWWIKAPDNANTVETMASWINHESPWNSSPPDGAMFTWNPINTTLPGFGSTSVVNSVNVRIYPTENQGVQATAATLEEPQYATILQNLRWSIGLCNASYSELSLWSGNGYNQVC
jgi:hypothetical protein